MASPGAGSDSTAPFIHCDTTGAAAYAATDDVTTTSDDVTTASTTGDDGLDPPSTPDCGVDDDEAPPPYSSEPSWRLTYVDFTPKCLDVGGILTSPKFETFDLMVARANSYLLRHCDVCVKCLETTRFNVNSVSKSGVIVDTRLATLANSTLGYIVYGLRMWIMPKSATQTTSAQIGYINVVPACLHPGGIFKRPLFDTLRDTVDKLNSLLASKPLPGRIINVESVRVPFRQYSRWVEPNRCHWRQAGDVTAASISFVRLYYEACDSPHPAHLGYRDFVPQEMSHTHRLLHPTEKYESMHDLCYHANLWLQQHPRHRLLNIENTHHPSKKEGKATRAQAERTLCFHHSSGCNLQCLRLWFTDQHEQPQHTFNQNTSLQCRMFCPQQEVCGGMFSSPVFETMLETRQRVKNWTFTYPALPVISAETVYVKLHSHLPEELWSAITHHRANLDYHSLSIAVLRLYVSCDITQCYSPPLDVTAGGGSYQNMSRTADDDDGTASDSSSDVNSDEMMADTRV